MYCSAQRSSVGRAAAFVSRTKSPEKRSRASRGSFLYALRLRCCVQSKTKALHNFGRRKPRRTIGRLPFRKSPAQSRIAEQRVVIPQCHPPTQERAEGNRSRLRPFLTVRPPVPVTSATDLMSPNPQSAWIQFCAPCQHTNAALEKILGD